LYEFNIVLLHGFESVESRYMLPPGTMYAGSRILL
jgi:hypothetical protein